jgi:hypothetical protein
MVAEWLNDKPEVLAVLIAVAGLLLAGVLARLTERGLIRVEGLVRRHLGQRAEHVDLGAMRQLLRGIMYFGTLLVFLLLALQALRISVVQESLAILLGHVPQLILAGLIILSGYLLGAMARSLLAGLLAVGADHLVPRFAQVLVITAAVLTGLAQTAINISFISDALIVLLAFFFGGLSLAFALGSRQLVENLLARRALDRYRIGDRVRVNDSEGIIIEILNTAVVLEAEHGILTVPTSRFVDSEILLLEETAADDDASGSE